VAGTTIRSRVLGALAGVSGGPTTFYTVLPGEFVLVKCIAITVGTNVATGSDTWVQDSNLVKLARFSQVIGTDDPTTQLYYGSWGLESGTSLQAQGAVGAADIYVTGFVFSPT
jgi:hypothetical protein